MDTQFITPETSNWRLSAHEWVAAKINILTQGAAAPNCDLDGLGVELNNTCSTKVISQAAIDAFNCLILYNTAQANVPACSTPTPTPSPSPRVPCVFSSAYYISNPNPWSAQAPFNQPVICGYNYLQLMDTQFITPATSNWRLSAHEWVAAWVNIITQGVAAPTCDLNLLGVELNNSCATKVISQAAIDAWNCLILYNTGQANAQACPTPIPVPTPLTVTCQQGQSTCGSTCCSQTCCGVPNVPGTQKCCGSGTFCCNSECVNGTAGVTTCCDDPLGNAYSCSGGSCCGFSCCPAGKYCGGAPIQSCCSVPWCGSQCCTTGQTCLGGICVAQFGVTVGDATARAVSTSSSAVSGSAIAGIVAGVIGVALIAAAGVMMVIKKKRAAAGARPLSSPSSSAVEIHL